MTEFELKTTTGQLWHTPMISGEEDGASDTRRGKVAFRKLSAQIAGFHSYRLATVQISKCIK